MTGAQRGDFAVPAPAGHAPDDETVERVARAIAAAAYFEESPDLWDRHSFSETLRADYRRLARAAVAALRGDEGEAR